MMATRTRRAQRRGLRDVGRLGQARADAARPIEIEGAEGDAPHDEDGQQHQQVGSRAAGCRSRERRAEHVEARRRRRGASTPRRPARSPASMSCSRSSRVRLQHARCSRAGRRRYRSTRSLKIGRSKASARRRRAFGSKRAGSDSKRRMASITIVHRLPREEEPGGRLGAARRHHRLQGAALPERDHRAARPPWPRGA